MHPDRMIMRDTMGREPCCTYRAGDRVSKAPLELDAAIEGHITANRDLRRQLEQGEQMLLQAQGMLRDGRSVDATLQEVRSLREHNAMEDEVTNMFEARRRFRRAAVRAMSEDGVQVPGIAAVLGLSIELVAALVAEIPHDDRPRGAS